MAITYNWEVTQLQTTKTDTVSDFVTVVSFMVTGVDGDYTSSLLKRVTFNEVPTENYTPYQNLTELQVIDWVKNTLGQENINKIEESIANNINLIKGSTDNLPQDRDLPW